MNYYILEIEKNQIRIAYRAGHLYSIDFINGKIENLQQICKSIPITEPQKTPKLWLKN